jgi:hypothetical protein
LDVSTQINKIIYNHPSIFKRLKRKFQSRKTTKTEDSHKNNFEKTFKLIYKNFRTKKKIISKLNKNSKFKPKKRNLNIFCKLLNLKKTIKQNRWFVKKLC